MQCHHFAGACSDMMRRWGGWKKREKKKKKNQSEGWIRWHWDWYYSDLLKAHRWPWLGSLKNISAASAADSSFQHHKKNTRHCRFPVSFSETFILPIFQFSSSCLNFFILFQCPKVSGATLSSVLHWFDFPLRQIPRSYWTLLSYASIMHFPECNTASSPDILGKLSWPLTWCIYRRNYVASKLVQKSSVPSGISSSSSSVSCFRGNLVTFYEKNWQALLFVGFIVSDAIWDKGMMLWWETLGFTLKKNSTFIKFYEFFSPPL